MDESRSKIKIRKVENNLLELLLLFNKTINAVMPKTNDVIVK